MCLTLVAGSWLHMMLLLVCGPCPVHPAAWVELGARCVAGSWASWEKKTKNTFGEEKWRHGSVFSPSINEGVAQVDRDLGGHSES